MILFGHKILRPWLSSGANDVRNSKNFLSIFAIQGIFSA